MIHQNISSTITLPWLAKQLNLSPSYLSSLFKQKVGRSISEYIRLVRLEKVKDMISEGRYTIAQISDIMGYCSPTYLSTEFKREYDMSPKEYKLFFYMLKNRNIALSRDKLLSEVWGYDYFGDDRTLDTHIKLLRRSLGKYADYIVTLRGVGYRFDTGKIL